jgi:hypothetical protein
MHSKQVCGQFTLHLDFFLASLTFLNHVKDAAKYLQLNQSGIRHSIDWLLNNAAIWVGGKVLVLGEPSR